MSNFDSLSSAQERNDATKTQIKLFLIPRKTVKDGSVETLFIAGAEILEVRKWWIPDSITMLSAKGFEGCKAIELLSFESNSRLTRLESSAFSFSSL
jgi:hypothetical protein